MKIYFEDLNQDTQKQLLENGINKDKMQDPIGELFEDIFEEQKTITKKELANKLGIPIIKVI